MLCHVEKQHVVIDTQPVDTFKMATRLRVLMTLEKEAHNVYADVLIHAMVINYAVYL